MSTDNIQQFVLKNGLKVICIPLENSTSISVGIFIKAGSRNETKNNNGIAHFLEHLTFKGTKNRNGTKLIQTLDNVGASYNASTSYQYTNYYISGNPKNIYLFIDIIIDLFSNPTLSTDDINDERGVILEELHMYEDDNSTLLFQELHNILYGNGPMGRPIIGTEENIKQFKQIDFINFRKKYYIPSNAVLSISGSFDPVSIKYYIEKIIKNYKFYPKQSINNQLIGLLPQQDPRLSIIHGNDIAQTLVVLSFESYKLTDQRNYQVDFIGSYLTSGFTSILFELLRTKLGAAYFCSAYNDAYFDHGNFIIYAGINNEKVTTSLIYIFNEIRKLKKDLISETRLKRLKKQRETSKLLYSRGPFDYMNQYGYDVLFNDGKFSSIEEVLKKYNSITTKQIRTVAKNMFQDSKMNLVILGNVMNKEKLIEAMHV